MEILRVSGFDVPPEKVHAYQAWVAENAAALSAALPEGVELVGFYVVPFSSEKGSGRFRFVIRFDSFAAMDRHSEAVRKDPLASIMAEGASFGDFRVGANSSSELWKSISDTAFIRVE